MFGLSVRLYVRPCVRQVRKKCLYSLYSTKVWYQTCTNCSSWPDLLMPRSGLCHWPIFHAWVKLIKKKLLSLYISTYGCYIHQTCTNCLSCHDLLMPHNGLCHWYTFHASETKTIDGNSGAPVMVPVTIVSSFYLSCWHNYLACWHTYLACWHNL